MSQSNKGAIYTIITWGVIFALALSAWFLFFKPKKTELILSQTGSQERFKEEIVCLADSFSGYALLRHPKFQEKLSKHGIKWTLQDDQADYEQRLQNLEHDKCDLAVFTVDAYLKTAVKANLFPGTIILVIDESKGADGIVSMDPDITTLDHLNKENLKFVLTPDSPSEFLARVLVHSFQLPLIPEELPIQPENGSEDVLATMLKDKKQDKAFVMWEPQLASAIKQGGKVLMDSSKTNGMIVDVLLANRNFLKNKEHLIKTLLSEYLSLRFEISQSHAWQETIQKDGFLTQTRLSDEQSRRIIDGIQWKNTMDNYLHFGLDPDHHGQHIEDILNRIWKVLTQTKAWGDQTPTDPPVPFHHLYYSKTWQNLKNENFRPSFAKINLEAAQKHKQLPPLSELEWQKMNKIGQIQVPPIQFARGASRLTLGGERSIQDLNKLLISWPHYYLEIQGNTREVGDLEANRKLALDRATAVKNSLLKLGCSTHRLRLTQAQSKGSSGQSVEFTFYEPEY